LAIPPDSLNMLDHSEDNLFGSPVEMDTHPFYPNSISASHELQMNSTLTTSSVWDDHSRSSSPIFHNDMYSNTFMDSPPDSNQDFSVNSLDLPSQFVR
jgi:hypothetical protein